MIEEGLAADYLEGMSEHDLAKFRALAETCRQEAERALSVPDKEMWLRMAGEWTTLAQNIERRLKMN